MLRFAHMLAAGCQATGLTTEIWWPPARLGAMTSSTTTGLGKWLGYVDKWLLFPLLLRWRLHQPALRAASTRFHICDHSNAPYLKYLPPNQTGITCHDVLAIRGALGYLDAHAPASSFGKILQRWILHHLSRAQRLATVSKFTMNQLGELTTLPPTSPANWQVIPNALNADFNPLNPSRIAELLTKINFPTGMPFLLHVGSGLPRKNRRLLLDMAHALGSSWQGAICFAGEAPDADLLTRARALGLEKRVVSIVKPDHETLVALYSTCEAFVFPSLSEGFGWPVIEAQACGAPVIASQLAPMPEVGGEAALYADPTNPAAFAAAFLSLRVNATRTQLIERGLQNASRFRPEHMTRAYIALLGLEDGTPQQ
jgi:glycosyltransferase involved in cell wall biosynthesis